MQEMNFSYVLEICAAINRLINQARSSGACVRCLMLMLMILLINSQGSNSYQYCSEIYRVDRYGGGPNFYNAPSPGETMEETLKLLTYQDKYSGAKDSRKDFILITPTRLINENFGPQPVLKIYPYGTRSRIFNVWGSEAAVKFGATLAPYVSTLQEVDHTRTDSKYYFSVIQFTQTVGNLTLWEISCETETGQIPIGITWTPGVPQIMFCCGVRYKVKDQITGWIYRANRTHVPPELVEFNKAFKLTCFKFDTGRYLPKVRSFATIMVEKFIMGDEELNRLKEQLLVSEGMNVKFVRNILQIGDPVQFPFFSLTNEGTLSVDLVVAPTRVEVADSSSPSMGIFNGSYTNRLEDPLYTLLSSEVSRNNIYRCKEKVMSTLGHISFWERFLGEMETLGGGNRPPVGLAFSRASKWAEGLNRSRIIEENSIALGCCLEMAYRMDSVDEAPVECSYNFEWFRRRYGFVNSFITYNTKPAMYYNEAFGCHCFRFIYDKFGGRTEWSCGAPTPYPTHGSMPQTTPTMRPPMVITTMMSMRNRTRREVWIPDTGHWSFKINLALLALLVIFSFSLVTMTIIMLATRGGSNVNINSGNSVDSNTNKGGGFRR